MDDYQFRLLKLISDEFDGVTLDDGVTLHQTIVIDNYGAGDPLEREIAEDERTDWRRLIDDPRLMDVDGVGGLCFYDAKGIRFHLPAYLSAIVKDPACSIRESLLFNLTHMSDYQRERFSILSPRQRRCVAAVLSYLQDRYSAGRPYYDASDLSIAIENYWMQDRIDFD
jgi:hypothetical protein